MASRRSSQLSYSRTAAKFSLVGGVRAARVQRTTRSLRRLTVISRPTLIASITVILFAFASWRRNLAFGLIETIREPPAFSPSRAGLLWTLTVGLPCFRPTLTAKSAIVQRPPARFGQRTLTPG